MSRDIILRFAGPHRWLSNFWPEPVQYNGELYPSVEHAYQAAKTRDEAEKAQFRDFTLSPGAAKRAGRRVTMRSDWNEVRLVIMLDLLRKKFSKIGLRERLLATGDAEIVEGNDWNDTFWGVCNGRGENWLGMLIMTVRAELREGLL